MKSLIAGLMLFAASVVPSNACGKLPLDASIEEYQVVLKAIRVFLLDSEATITQIVKFDEKYTIIIRNGDNVDLFEYGVEWLDLEDDGISCSSPYAQLMKRETYPGFGAN